MCGFVVIVNDLGKPVDVAELRLAADTLKHRGPDDEGYFVDKNVGFGFRRLSILDLSTHANQPFEDSENRFVIVFNGEIYNYIEIREELLKRGYTFRSSGDTEVLLAAYEEWGEACLDKLNGMWAFLIFDRKERTIFGSRDRFGVKPLFVSRVQNRYVFASEIKAIQRIECSTRAFNWNTASRYLIHGSLSRPDDIPDTMFSRIREVPAGHCFKVGEDGQYRLWPFWELKACNIDSPEDPVSEFARIFHDSVKLRMRSDVPVGVCLSGGLDSTSIICHMPLVLGRDATEPIRAFSYMDEQFDETRQIRATVEATNAQLYQLDGAPASLLKRLEEVLWYHDEPIHSLNVLVSFELYRMASQSGVKVMLNGQGADETWAGYPRYFFNHWCELLRTRRIKQFLAESKNYSMARRADVGKVRRQTVNLLWRNQLRRFAHYRSLGAAWRRRRVAKDRWFSKELLDTCPREVPDFESLDLDTALEKSICHDPLPLYLRIEDRNSMANSVETRLPFLDYRLVQLAIRTRPTWKLKDEWNKYTIREAVKGVIPEIVRTRVEKMGFPVSARKWFAGPLYQASREIISSKSARDSGVFEVDAILKDLERHRNGQLDCSDKLLRVVQIQLLLDRATRFQDCGAKSLKNLVRSSG